MLSAVGIDYGEWYQSIVFGLGKLKDWARSIRFSQSHLPRIIRHLCGPPSSNGNSTIQSRMAKNHPDIRVWIWFFSAARTEKSTGSVFREPFPEQYGRCASAYGGWIFSGGSQDFPVPLFGFLLRDGHGGLGSDRVLTVRAFRFQTITEPSVAWLFWSRNARFGVAPLGPGK